MLCNEQRDITRQSMTTFTQYWKNMAGNKKKHLEKGVITNISTCHCVTFSLSILTVITAYIVWKYSEYIVFKLIMGEYLTRFCKLKVEIIVQHVYTKCAVLWYVPDSFRWTMAIFIYIVQCHLLDFFFFQSCAGLFYSKLLLHKYCITCNNPWLLRLWSLLLWTEFGSLKAGVRTREVSDEYIYYCWK